MALKETCHQMRQLLNELCHDLEKAKEGNKAAAQRVRTASLKFTKVSKVYRKESVADEKKAAHKKTASKKKALVKKASKKSRK